MSDEYHFVEIPPEEIENPKVDYEDYSERLDEWWDEHSKTEEYVKRKKETEKLCTRGKILWENLCNHLEKHTKIEKDKGVLLDDLLKEIENGVKEPRNTTPDIISVELVPIEELFYS